LILRPVSFGAPRRTGFLVFAMREVSFVRVGDQF
jgi:hypothetical protein